MAFELTSAGNIMVLSISGFLDVAQQIEGWSVDEAFATNRIKMNETMMSIDGLLFGGFTFVERPMEIVLMGGSPSCDFFDEWAAAMQANRVTFQAQGSITIPSLEKYYVLVNGYLTGYEPMSTAKKIQQPRRFEITWQDIQSNPI